jgi:DNA polymerase-3 subunit alpha
MDSLGKNRNILLKSLDKAMEVGQKVAKGVGIQKTLFDAAQDVSVGDIEEEYDEVPSPSPKELLAMEKESLGFYVTGHPLDLYRRDLQRRVSCSIQDVLEKEQEGQEVQIGGMVVYFKEITTKKGGNLMAFVQMEDWDGKIEVVIFPDLYSQVSMLLLLDEPVLVKGRVAMDAQGEDKKIIAQEVFLLRDLPGQGVNSKKLQPGREEKAMIKIPLEELDEEAVEQVWNIVRRHPGQSVLIFRLLHNEGFMIDIEADHEFKVSMNKELRRDLESVLGGAVEIS